MSHSYEHTVVNSIYNETPHYIKVYPCGFSGSNAIPQPDILVTEPHGLNHAIELKKSRSDYVYVDEEDIEQLIECEGPATPVYLVVKFTNRQPVVIRYYGDVTNAPDGWDELSPTERFARLAPDAFDANVTDSGNLSLSRPSTEEWPSSRAGMDDAVAVVNGCGIDNEHSQDIDTLADS